MVSGKAQMYSSQRRPGYPGAPSSVSAEHPEAGFLGRGPGDGCSTLTFTRE
jgi:hypothetical protein